MALTEKGNLFSWGNNCYGQLGVGDYSDRNTPTLISFDFGDSISSIATGGVHSMAFTKSGNIFVWGYNACGQLGLGDTTNQNKPHLLDSSFSPKIFKASFQNSENLSNFLLHLLDSGDFSDVPFSESHFTSASSTLDLQNFFPWICPLLKNWLSFP